MTSADLGTDLAPLLEYTALAPDVTLEHMSRMCMEARTRGFTAICVNPLFVAAVAPLLQGSQTFISTVVGEPLGALTTRQKVYLATTALEEGALEIDLMVGIAALRADDRAGVRGEILAMAQVLARNPNALLKVVVDTALLDEAQQRALVRLAIEGGAHYVSAQGTGAATTVQAVKTLHTAADGRLGVRAAGVDSTSSVHELMQAGANRLASDNPIALLSA